MQQQQHTESLGDGELARGDCTLDGHPLNVVKHCHVCCCNDQPLQHHKAGPHMHRHIQIHRDTNTDTETQTQTHTDTHTPRAPFSAAPSLVTRWHDAHPAVVCHVDVQQTYTHLLTRRGVLDLLDESVNKAVVVTVLCFSDCCSCLKRLILRQHTILYVCMKSCVCFWTTLTAKRSVIRKSFESRSKASTAWTTCDNDD
jgi:hypothetical protein